MMPAHRGIQEAVPRGSPYVPDQVVKKRPPPRIDSDTLLVESQFNLRDGEGRGNGDAAHGQTNQAEMRKAVDAAEAACGDGDDANRLAAEAFRFQEIERVYEHPRDAFLVFERDDYQAVRLDDPCTKGVEARRPPVRVLGTLPQDRQLELGQIDQLRLDAVAPSDGI